MNFSFTLSFSTHLELFFPNKSQWRKLFALLTKCSQYSGKWVENVENAFSTDVNVTFGRPLWSWNHACFAANLLLFNNVLYNFPNISGKKLLSIAHFIDDFLMPLLIDRKYQGYSIALGMMLTLKVA